LTELWLIGLQLGFALLLDRIFAEPSRFHPLVGFGYLANWFEHKINQYSPSALLTRGHHSPKMARIKGSVCWAILVLPIPLGLYIIDKNTPIWWLLNSLVLYLAIGMQSLKLHAMQIHQPLVEGNIKRARYFTGYMVSRDTHTLTSKDISRAGVESVLENGHDGVIASLFYFVLGGAPLVVLHRLANTLDAMWGYKTARFLYFGWWAARADDHLGWLSTYCTCFLYVLAGKNRLNFNILSLAWQQAKHYKSKNGGRCMATGASALGFTLGGVSQYQGNTIHSPVLGRGREVALHDIPLSVDLVTRSAWIFASAVLLIGLVANGIF
jgi:adenosylcobinamide-phosphate synthase